MTKMDESLPISLARVSAIINQMHETFTTADIIRGYSGGFISNSKTPAIYSLNAQFGKLLRRNETVLRIKEVRANVSITDDTGNKTNTAKWKRLTNG